MFIITTAVLTGPVDANLLPREAECEHLWETQQRDAAANLNREQLPARWARVDRRKGIARCSRVVRYRVSKKLFGEASPIIARTTKPTPDIKDNMNFALRKASRSFVTSRRCLPIARRAYMSGGGDFDTRNNPSNPNPHQDKAVVRRSTADTGVQVADRVVAVEPLEWQREEDGKGNVYCESP